MNRNQNGGTVNYLAGKAEKRLGDAKEIGQDAQNAVDCLWGR